MKSIKILASFFFFPKAITPKGSTLKGADKYCSKIIEISGKDRNGSEKQLHILNIKYFRRDYASSRLNRTRVWKEAARDTLRAQRRAITIFLSSDRPTATYLAPFRACISKWYSSPCTITATTASQFLVFMQPAGVPKQFFVVWQPV